MEDDKDYLDDEELSENSNSDFDEQNDNENTFDNQEYINGSENNRFIPNKSTQQSPKSQVKEKVNDVAKDVEKKLIKEASKAALAAYGVPPEVTDKVADAVLNSEVVDKTLNKVNNQAMKPLDKALPESKVEAEVPTEEEVEEEAVNETSSEKRKSPPWLLIGCLSSLIITPIVTVIIVVVLSVTLILSPLDWALNAIQALGAEVSSFFEKSSNFVMLRGFNTNEETFHIELKDAYIEYVEKGVIIDIPLIVSILSYNDILSEDFDLSCIEKEDCEGQDSQKENYALMRKKVPILAENMAKMTGKRYFCNSVFSELVNGEYDPYLSNQTKTSFCGFDKDSCQCPVKDTNPTNTFITSEDLYENISEEDFRLWLKDNFIEDYLISKKYTFPEDSEDKEEKIVNIIDEMYMIKNQYAGIYDKYGILEGYFGYFLPNNGKAGPIPNEILVQLYNPIGYEQRCKVNSCYGYYTANKDSDFYCKKHNGIDLARGPEPTKIYNIADGKVIGISSYQRTCDPTIDANRSDSTCMGTTITILHTFTINGEEVEMKSLHVHLAKFENSNWPRLFAAGQEINLYKGQIIGDMGNTGLSTGTHLHFSLYDKDNKLYNPEQLVALREDCLIPNCNAIREACRGK
jgi:hypothetical protein